MKYVKSVWIIAVVLCLAACSKNIDTSEAVKDGVIKDISKKGMAINAMEVSVDSVSFREKEATAQVSFRPKGSAPGTPGITMNYALERVGDEWHIKNRNMQGHDQARGGADASQMPPGHPTTTPGDGQQMPPGHPTTGAGGGQQIPPGHPQVSPGIQK